MGKLENVIDIYATVLSPATGPLVVAKVVVALMVIPTMTARPARIILEPFNTLIAVEDKENGFV